MKFIPLIALLALFMADSGFAGQRINQEGRLLGVSPTVTNAVLFNTAQADAVLSAMQIFPVTNAWNEDISRRPLLANSSAMIAQIKADLASSRQNLRAFYEMNFVLIPDSQPLVPITFVKYADQSDLGPYPISTNMPIETWPLLDVAQTLLQWQQDTFKVGGDRHAIIVQPTAGIIREMWQAKLVGTNWQAANGAKFDLKNNRLRPDGWTSGDAAGLPMFPALVRYDECERGMVEHAVRLVVGRSRQQHIYPATHDASSDAATLTNIPAMGQRLRLKSSFAIPATWTKEEKAVLLGFKKYGAIVADNGGFFSFSVTPDDRWPSVVFDHLSTIDIANFEVIQTTGPTEGPRSPGAPVVNAGGDKTLMLGTPCTLRGSLSSSGTPQIQWRQASGPGTVSFGNATQTNTTATFSTPGLYTLLLSADDGVHAVAYDAAVINVTFPVAMKRAGTNLTLNWTGQFPACIVEKSASLPPSWTPALTTSAQTVTLPISKATEYFRVKSQ